MAKASRKEILKVRPLFQKKKASLALKYLDILELVKEGICFVKTLSETLKVANSTIADRIKVLVKEELLYKIPQSYPHMFTLTNGGFQALENYFTESLKLGVPEVSDSKTVLVTQKAKQKPVVPFDTLRFSETLKEIIGNLPKHYPNNPLFTPRPHWITYKFPILQQSKYLTYHCQNERGYLGKQSWISILPMGPKKRPTWYKYHGSISFYNANYYIQFTPENVIVRLQSFFSNNPIEAIARIVDLLFIAKKELEDSYSINNSRLILGNLDPHYIAYAITQHFGIVLHPLAVICQELGIVLQNKRLMIDNSHGVPELETIHSGFSQDDAIFLFEDLTDQVENRFGVREARFEIQSVREKSQLRFNQLNNQILVLNDELKLSNQRNNVLEGYLEQTSKNLAELSKLVRDSQYSNVTQFEQYDETLSEVKQTLETFTIQKRPRLEQVILNFLRTTPNDSGFTRQFLRQELNIPLGSINATIVKLRKQGLVIIEKVGNERGRVFLTANYRRNM